MTEAYREKYKNFIIKIMHDESAENPFTSCDCEPDIWGAHRRYDFNTTKQAPLKSDIVLSLPLYMLDHSGLAFSTTPFSCPWDSGQYGFIYWTKQKIKDGQGEVEYPLSTDMRAKLTEQLISATKLLNDYASGNVYGYTIETEAGESLDSCWGYYGDITLPDGKPGYALECARDVCDAIEISSLPLLACAGLLSKGL